MMNTYEEYLSSGKICDEDGEKEVIKKYGHLRFVNNQSEEEFIKMINDPRFWLIINEIQNTIQNIKK